MKRLFYSTVAVLAFSVSGMANTIELEDFESKINIKTETIETKLNQEMEDSAAFGRNCFDVANVAERFFVMFYRASHNGRNPSEELRYNAFSVAYESCMFARGGIDLTVMP